ILAAFAMQHWPRRAMLLMMIVVAIVIAIAAVHWPVDKPRIVADLAPLVVAIFVVAVARKEIAAPALVALLLIQRTIADGSLIPTNESNIACRRLGLRDAMEARGDPLRVAR